MREPRPVKSVDKTLDRDRLARFLAALNAREACLRRDEYGDWAIKGTRGHIYAIPEASAFYLVVVPSNPCEELSALAWTWAKKHLAFCRLTQDGDTDGIFRINRHPTPEEAETIRDVLGIGKKRTISPENLEKLRDWGKDWGRRQGQ